MSLICSTYQLQGLNCLRDNGEVADSEFRAILGETSSSVSNTNRAMWSCENLGLLFPVMFLSCFLYLISP